MRATFYLMLGLIPLTGLASETEPGRLGPFVLRDLQGGVAGFSGTQIVIDAATGWSRSNVEGGRVGEPEAKGPLSAFRLNQLTLSRE